MVVVEAGEEETIRLRLCLDVPQEKAGNQVLVEAAVQLPLAWGSQVSQVAAEL